jgi:hypothetical protein
MSDASQDLNALVAVQKVIAPAVVVNLKAAVIELQDLAKK